MSNRRSSKQREREREKGPTRFKKGSRSKRRGAWDKAASEGKSQPEPKWKVELRALRELARLEPGTIATVLKRGFELHLRYLPGEVDDAGEAFDWSLTAHPQHNPRYAWLNRAAAFLGANPDERVNPEEVTLAIVTWSWLDPADTVGREAIS